MSSETTVVFCTCPDQTTAMRIAETLVEDRHCACVNLIPGVTSVYLWEGKRESANEVMILIKTRAESYPALEKAIRSIHPYELPEIIALPVADGLPEYLDWVARCSIGAR